MANKKEKMSEEDLQTLCAQEETQAIGGVEGTLAGQREKAYSFYLGEPLGNEEDGRSQLVSTEVADTIEWVMPALMKIFTSGEDTVKFDPTGPEDEEQAQQATDFSNWIFNKANPGFLILHDFIKDGLLLKNGIVKVWWEERTDKQKKTIGPLPDDAYTLLLDTLKNQPKGKDKPEITITAHTEYKPGGDEYDNMLEKLQQTIDQAAAKQAQPMQPPPGIAPPVQQGPQPPHSGTAGPPQMAQPAALMPPGAPPAPIIPPVGPGMQGNAGAPGASGGQQPALAPQAPPQMAPMEPMQPPRLTAEMVGTLHEVTLTEKTKSGMVTVMGVPPEEFLISKNARSIDKSNYCAHRFKRSLAKLLEDGYDEKKVMDLPTDTTTASDVSSEAQKRRDNTDDASETTSHRQGLLREVWVVEEYVLCDFDGDGIAEYRRVMRASGSSGPIFEHEDWEGPPPFSSGSPILMPHRFTGISLAELVMDLQVIKSQLIRQIIDNAYLTNHPELVVSDKVNVDDLLLTRLDKFIRLADGAMPGDGHVTPIVTPFSAGQTLPLLEYIDGLKENRTGVTRYNQGMDADSLNKTARGITQIMSAAQQRIELIARVFAETGIKDLFRQILRCAQKYQTKEQMIQLRNKWVPMDAREWRSQFNMTVSVGLGTGNQDQVLGRLNVLWNSLKEVVAAQGQFGVKMVDAENVYNIFKKMIQASGEKAPDQFISQPQPIPGGPPKDPKMVEVEQKGQIAQAEVAAKGKLAEAEMAAQAQTAAAEADLEMKKAAAEDERDRMKAANDLALAQQKADLEAKFKAEQAVRDFNLDMEKLKLEHEAKMIQLTAEIEMKRQANDAEMALKREVAGSQMELSDKVQNHKIESEDLKRKQEAHKKDTKSVDTYGSNIEKMLKTLTEAPKKKTITIKSPDGETFTGEVRSD